MYLCLIPPHILIKQASIRDDHKSEVRRKSVIKKKKKKSSSRRSSVVVCI